MYQEMGKQSAPINGPKGDDQGSKVETKVFLGHALPLYCRWEVASYLQEPYIEGG